MWEMAIAPAIAGVSSLIGGERANKARAKEAAKNRNFQERMRNTQWQSAIADMTAAGINPALAYSQGPNAAPGGSMAQQMDAVSPAVSSAMQAKRMEADLRLVNAQADKARIEGWDAGNREIISRARRDFLMDTETGGIQPIRRLINAEIFGAEARARREGATADTLAPVAELARTMGIWGPILMGAGKFLPGMMRGVGSLRSPTRNFITKNEKLTKWVPRGRS